ncbi:hypothetical protein C0995_007177 [Termitomyces sp. Mi166|nr:hypothetical protein C0995_007177 [Termitomyces sp. Mi166\
MCDFYGFRDKYKFRYPQLRARPSPPLGLIQPTDPRPPKLNLSDLECLKVLGKGVTGKVLLVRSLRSRHRLDRCGSKYALKVLTRADARASDKIDPKWKDHERSILTKLPWNPFVAGILQVFKDEKNLYTLMEYLPCGSLRSLLQNRGPFDPTSSAFYFCNIAAGLEFLEDYNIYHRDLKPDNILLGADGYLVLADFGEGAHLYDYANTKWDEVGSPAYSAPELMPHNWDGERVIFSGVDWWSAGIILYEMTYRKLVSLPFPPFKVTTKGFFSLQPFWGANEFQIHWKKKAGVIHWRPEVKVGNCLKSLISGLLTLDTTTRLGANGAAEVISHEWLKQVKWSKIKGRTYLKKFGINCLFLLKGQYLVLGLSKPPLNWLTTIVFRSVDPITITILNMWRMKKSDIYAMLRIGRFVRSRETERAEQSSATILYLLLDTLTRFGYARVLNIDNKDDPGSLLSIASLMTPTLKGD